MGSTAINQIGDLIHEPQGREIRKGGNLVYVDSPAVRAVKHGRLLVLEGIEKAERGIMPVRIFLNLTHFMEYISQIGSQ